MREKVIKFKESELGAAGAALLNAARGTSWILALHLKARPDGTVFATLRDDQHPQEAVCVQLEIEKEGGFKFYWRPPESFYNNGGAVSGLMIWEALAKDFLHFQESVSGNLAMSNDWITQKEAADLVDISFSTIRALVHRGQVPIWRDPETPGRNGHTLVSKAAILRRYGKEEESTENDG